MTTHRPRIVDLSETQPNRRRGGDLRALLTPTAVGATSGFMGLAIIRPGERIGEHYHPYSEEFVYVVDGLLEVDLDGEAHAMRPDQGLLIPPHVRHRFRNVGDVEARMVFHLGPLAPRPELGHVDTEVTDSAETVQAAERGAPPERTGAAS
ncbi:putative monooxygenase [Streptomyces sp. BpilaLS-43]|uniref:cupin domain-containing protein n=1 Tax=Streptomyces sp. BpilaLS-43 TaxID=1839778 RepID=UPI00081BA254|nr:cupin domain-containing protein [Streptomyces sp. BpilaLS-43]SCE02205.1 putative monooxygenase [Streptomyces sp. BpilaLS-43]